MSDGGFTYLARAARLAISHPREGLDRIRNRLELATGGSSGPGSYTADAAWRRTLEQHLAPGAAAPAEQFDRLWAEFAGDVATSGLPPGEGHDADPAFARAVWTLALALRPSRVVETGVARGIVTRFLLDALERSGQGLLWSIDLPPVSNAWHEHAAAAVPLAKRERWTYLRGSSRRRLPGLLAELGTIDLFVHDSLHTARNMRFELELAWAHLAPGGAIVADDVQENAAFAELAARSDAGPSVVAAEGKPGSLFGVLLKPRARS